ncbi:MAG: sortase [Oscillospiraceae bacterium]|nr:sortase [Oscillospiraceae bacterium]
MRKMIKIFAVLILLVLLSTSTSAYNYNFSSGADSATTFDKPTSSDDPTPQNPLTENVRRNKDVAYNPPPYGIFGGDIATDPSSPYYTQDKSSAVATSSQAVTYSDYSSGNIADIPPVSNLSDDILPSTSVYNNMPEQTLPLYYADGTIGTLEIPRFNRTIPVYEGESLENLKIRAGHFTSTSVWDGNVAICAHNRGVPNNFDFVKDLNIGDKIIYSTQYSVRTYEIVSKTQITETDTSGLAWSSEDILSLYTCLEDTPGYRWYIVVNLAGN